MPPAFRYFELLDDERGRYVFWEIGIAGPTLELRHGPVGTIGKYERESCSSEALARHEYQLRIDTHLAEGFRECADRRLDARTRALEAAIDADPDDASAYMVYADWIQTLGDPRGGLIVAQLAGETDREAQSRADAFLNQHEALFLGPLAEHIGYDGAALEPTWRRGFIREARFPVRDVFGTAAPERVLEMVLEHPSARWLGEITIETRDRSSGCQPLVDVLARHVCPHVRRLTIGEVGEARELEYDEPDDPRAYWWRPATSLIRLWRALPNLERLVIRGDPSSVGALVLPRLAHLEIQLRRLDPGYLHAIASARCPLERLELRFLWPNGPELADALWPILASPLARGLDHLAIAGAQATHVAGMDDLCAVISQQRWPSLHSLDLSQGLMTDRGAEALAASSLDLELLDVSRNHVSARGVRELERIAKLVIHDA